MTPGQRREIARIALAILERDYDQGRIPAALYHSQRRELVRMALAAPKPLEEPNQ